MRSGLVPFGLVVSRAVSERVMSEQCSTVGDFLTEVTKGGDATPQ